MTNSPASKVLEAVQDLLPKIADRADQCERDRRIPDETIAELKEAGFFSMLQPKRWGGLEADPVEFYEVVRTLAGVCGSTGWVASVVGGPPVAAGAVPRRRATRGVG